MVIKEIDQSVSISAEFKRSLFELPEGNKFNMCIQCGTCGGVCPFGFCMEYTPRKIISAVRMNEFEEVMESDRVWMCVSCYACENSCPQQIPLTSGLMTHLKEEMLLSGNVPGELQNALEYSQRYGNPLGESPRKRADWMDGSKAPILRKIMRPVEVLWFVGDYASYHPVVQESTRAMAKLLEALEVDYAILGPEEVSDGDSQRLAGEFGLFEVLAEKNAKSFSKYEFNEILTTDPHAYNAIKNEYPKLGFSYPVKHYSQFLAERLDQLKPMFKNNIDARAAFHDPCYLGRVNGIFEEPRLLLEAIPIVQIKEMSHSRENSLCCGGGGGGMWLDGYQWDIAKTRPSEWRVQEMVASKPLEDFVSTFIIHRPKRRERKVVKPERMILVVACPYEKPRFLDASKVVPEAKEVEVMDIAELLVETIGL